MKEISDRLLVINLINRFGLHTDWREWNSLRALFQDEIKMDYSSLNGNEPSKVKTDDVITYWH